MDRINELSVALLLLFSGTGAEATVTTQPLDWRMSSLERGLERVKDQFLDISSHRDAEFVGAVLKTPEGHYEFTYGQGMSGQDQVSFRIRRPADRELVGLWHTHGADGPARAFFSPTDAKLVEQTGLPFYLIRPDGEIRVLRPDHLTGRGRLSLRMGGSMARLPKGSHPGERVSGSGIGERTDLNNCAV